jgi:hypothetical protein
LVDIYTDSEEPKYNIGNEIDNSVKTICTLHVPIGCKAKYKANSGWNTFKDIVEYDTNIVNGINGVEENGTKLVAYFTISGKKLDKPQRGLNIVRMSDGTVRKVMY